MLGDPPVTAGWPPDCLAWVRPHTGTSRSGWRTRRSHRPWPRSTTPRSCRRRGSASSQQRPWARPRSSSPRGRPRPPASAGAGPAPLPLPELAAATRTLCLEQCSSPPPEAPPTGIDRGSSRGSGAPGAVEAITSTPLVRAVEARPRVSRWTPAIRGQRVVGGLEVAVTPWRASKRASSFLPPACRSRWIDSR